MRVELTVKVSASTRGELIDSFGTSYRKLREHYEKLVEEKILPADNIRWLLVGGQWHPNEEEQYEPHPSTNP